ncbi:MAG: Rpn family recombination-promoting nuclease/putative transposase [Pirellulales bacterium]
MPLGIVPTVDYAFKRLFGDPNHSSVLLHLLNSVLAGEFVVEQVQIVTPFLERDFQDDRLAILDLRIRDAQGRQYNLEMQTTAVESLPSRLLYYLSSMYSEQLAEGDSWEQLTPAISVCFLDCEFLDQTQDFHTRFQVCSLQEQLVLTDQFELHLVELPKFRGTASDMTQASPLEKWAFFFQHAAELNATDFESVFRDEAFVEAGRILEMISKTPEERLRYELRLKVLRDQQSNLEFAERRGREQGLEQGLEQGIEQGITRGREQGRELGYWIGRIRLLQELLGDPDASVEELEQQPLEQLALIARKLEQRFKRR